MAISFKQFAIDEDHIVTMGPLAGPMDMTLGNDWHDALNDQFADAFAHPILTPDIGYKRLYELLAPYELALPLLSYTLDPHDGEHIYMIDGAQPWFLYTAYVQDDNGLYEFYAEIMDEPTLNDFLSSTEDEEEDTALDT
jgi:hypothetical protein